MKPDKAFVDAPQVSTQKFKAILLGLMKTSTKLTVENYADSIYTVCGAASIIAKVRRDKAIRDIKEKVGYDIGVGYPHDERSIDFVKKALKSKKYLNLIRHSWITVIELKKKKEQKKLGEY